MEYIWIIWLIAAGVLFLIEALTVNLVTIWFALSAVVTVIVSLFTDNLILQLFVFVITATVLLILTRPVIGKYMKPKATNICSLIEDEGIVVKEINKDKGLGQVSIDGKIWSARTKESGILKEGEKIVVTDIKGVALIVERKED